MFLPLTLFYIFGNTYDPHFSPLTLLFNKTISPPSKDLTVLNSHEQFFMGTSNRNGGSIKLNYNPVMRGLQKTPEVGSPRSSFDFETPSSPDAKSKVKECSIESVRQLKKIQQKLTIA